MSLSVVIVGHVAEARTLPLNAADEVIAVLPKDSKTALGGGANVRRVHSSAPAAQRANIGISLASGDWVIVLDGFEKLAAGWREQVETLLANSDVCAQRFVPANGGAPVVAVWRQAFAYGALYGGFEQIQAALENWLTDIFPRHRHRILAREGSATQSVTWLETVRVADGSRHQPAITETHDGPYNPRLFWETGGRGWVKWEAYQPDEQEILAIVKRTQPRDVIELGCGGGRNGRYFDKADWYAGLDISVPLLEKARDRQASNSAGLVCGDAAQLPFASAAAGLVFADSTLQHVEPHRIANAVREIVRVSRRYICLIEFTDELPGHDTWFKQPHMFRYDYEDLFKPHTSMLMRQKTVLQVQPAVKEAFLFEKAA